MNGPAELWQQNLKKEGYEHKCKNIWQYYLLRRLPRIWRSIIKITGIKKEAKIFEVGCGGGIHLIRLALNGFDVTGIDVSSEVLYRAKTFIDEVKLFDSSVVDKIKIINGDFMKINFEKYSIKQSYFDLTFNMGVIEHYLRQHDRIDFLVRKLNLTKSGGAIVCVVPSGVHPFRGEQKKLNWGGYNIPEVDYSSQMLFNELKTAGAKKVKVIPHNIGGYLLTIPTKKWLKLFKVLKYLMYQLSTNILTDNFKINHAYSLIGVGWKE